MLKLSLRFFIIVLVVTLLALYLILVLSKKLVIENTLGNVVNIESGTLHLMDNYLAHYPPSQWHKILQKNRPLLGGNIDVIPLDQLRLSHQKITELKAHQWVKLDTSGNSFFPLLQPGDVNKPPVYIYKLTNDPHYAYQIWLDFTSRDQTQLALGWLNQLISKKMQTTQESAWPEILKPYGLPITIQSLKTVTLSTKEKQMLQEGEWVDHYTNTKEEVYAPSSDQHWLIHYGPAPVRLVSAYQTIMVIIGGFLFLEFLAFIAALLFARSLQKIKNLANAYGQGDFSSQMTLNKTSVLFPLFTNLKRMGEKIKDLITSHKALTNSVAHELRTPLSRLRFSLALLKETKDIHQMENRTSVMEKDIEELETLISEILTYAKLDHMDLHIQLSPIPLEQLLRTAVEKSQPFQHQLITDTPLALQSTIVNANMLYATRALQNLLRNADHHAKALVKFFVLQNDGHYLQIIIEDDGPGIPPEDRKRVFNPFVQLSHESGEKNPGFGFGLAITKKIVEQHHWKIEITNSALGGVKIVITCPLS